MKSILKLGWLAGLGLLTLDHAHAAKPKDPIQMGFVETSYIGEHALEMSAKLDTGADTSSIHARDLEVYEKSDGDDWVRFRLIGDDGRRIRFDKNVTRYALIKLKTGGQIRRPVVLLDVCVGGVDAPAEFTLADREDFDYDVLLGREFLASRILVDSASKFTSTSECDRYISRAEAGRNADQSDD